MHLHINCWWNNSVITWKWPEPWCYHAITSGNKTQMWVKKWVIAIEVVFKPTIMMRIKNIDPKDNVQGYTHSIMSVLNYTE